ncbi:head GIN domain-containing protein [Flavobacterium rhizosphaerae]|uniref:Head GIN domain-containing protein n=1 Tax=Flavobacterium rhizosphaerae TaxID=3163298 RepID=A0ABW8YW41_9FLAO
MIKVLTYFTKIIITVIATLLFFSCGFEKVDGNGTVTTQQRDVKNGFTKVSAGSGLEVEIIHGSKHTITVEADENLMAHIFTEVSGDELEIKTDVNIGNAAEKKVTVTLPEIEAIEASSGVQVKTKKLKSDNLELSTSSGSHMETDIEANTAKCESSSGSYLKVNGTVEKLETHSSSGSTLDAGGLNAKNAKSEASSGSTTTVNATVELDAQASSGSSIHYVNTPSKLNTKASSGGSISQN